MGLTAAALLACSEARAQSCPQQSTPAFTAGGNVFGRTASQWNQYFAAKPDANNGILCNPKIRGTLSVTELPSIGFGDLSAPFDVTFGFASSVALTAPRNLTIDVVNGSRTLKLGSGLTILNDLGLVAGALKSTGGGTFSQASAADLSNGVSGSSAVCLTTNCVLVTPTLGVASGTQLTLTATQAIFDAGLRIFGHPSQGWVCAICLGGGASGTTSPIQAGGTIIGIGSGGAIGSIANAIDLAGVTTITDSLLKGPTGFKIKGDGSIVSANNFAGTYPASIAGTGYAIGANMSNASAEVNFINPVNGAGGFDWRQKTGASAGTVLAALTTGGLNLLTGAKYQIGGTQIAAADLSNGTTGTGAIPLASTLGSGGIEHLTFQPGLLTSVVNTKAVFYKVSKAATVNNISASAITFTTCTVNPVITVYECGTDASCAAPTTIGAATITAAGSAMVGTVSNPAIAAGDYVAWALSSGTCAALDAQASAQITIN